MSKDLDKSAKELDEATLNYESIKMHLYDINNQLAITLHLKKTIEENIGILKDRRIVAIASAYKKAKDDLAKINNSLSALKINKENMSIALEKAKNVMVECRIKHIHGLETQAISVINVNFKDRKRD